MSSALHAVQVGSKGDSIRVARFGFDQMDDFDKRMALEVIEDAFTMLDTLEGRWMAVGLCGAFYMCGLLSHAEWEALVAQIPMGEAWRTATLQ